MLPINKSHLRSAVKLGYLITQVTETPCPLRGSGGQNL